MLYDALHNWRHVKSKPHYTHHGDTHHATWGRMMEVDTGYSGWSGAQPAGQCECLPLLIFLCTIKSRSSLLAPAHPGCPRKRAVKWLWL